MLFSFENLLPARLLQEGRTGICLEPRTIRSLACFPNLTTKYSIYIYIYMVNYTDVQFGDSARHNNYGKKSENINYESRINGLRRKNKKNKF